MGPVPEQACTASAIVVTRLVNARICSGVHSGLPHHDWCVSLNRGLVPLREVGDRAAAVGKEDDPARVGPGGTLDNELWLQGKRRACRGEIRSRVVSFEERIARK